MRVGVTHRRAAKWHKPGVKTDRTGLSALAAHLTPVTECWLKAGFTPPPPKKTPKGRDTKPEHRKPFLHVELRPAQVSHGGAPAI